MATIHKCDLCGATVSNRYDLWEITFSPAEKMRGVPDGRRFERFEACNVCKRKAFTALMERSR